MFLLLPILIFSSHSPHIPNSLSTDLSSSSPLYYSFHAVLVSSLALSLIIAPDFSSNFLHSHLDHVSPFSKAVFILSLTTFQFFLYSSKFSCFHFLFRHVLNLLNFLSLPRSLFFSQIVLPPHKFPHICIISLPRHRVSFPFSLSFYFFRSAFSFLFLTIAL